LHVAILAGGLGLRLAGETEEKPKAMVEIGGRPILWHIMRHYGHYGFKQFVVALGYKGPVISDYVLSDDSMTSTCPTVLAGANTRMPRGRRPDWTVQLVDTGPLTQTGGRIRRLAPYLNSGTFMLTYCDGVSDVNLHDLLAFHRSHGKLATLTAVHPSARFGHLELDGDQVVRFSEKPPIRNQWINGGFFVLEPGVFDYIEGDDTQWEREPLERLAREGQLQAFRHTSFWHCMDTLYEKKLLEALWKHGNAPWKTWE
jgi:glucose-1-phosphate cytidylyltransferase